MLIFIFSGDYANIDDICRETNPEFRLEKVDLAEALVYLVSKGRQIFKEEYVYIYIYIYLSIYN